MKRAMVVAHPDDETLWGAGWILRHPAEWTIYACSIPDRDPVRALLFYDACEVLGARGVVLPYVERDSLNLKHLRLDGFEQIVTHNHMGEYGHRHHKQVHDYIAATYPSVPVVHFGYGMRKARELRLNEAEQSIKERALRCYSHVLLYAGRMMPKWQALLERYKIDMSVETYDAPA